MKKIILITLILLLTVNHSYAESDCSACDIKDAPAEVLQKYIETQKQVISRITSKASGKKDNIDISSLWKQFDVSINTIINFNDYFSTFDYIKLELFTSVPKEIRRDKLKIEKEITNVQNQIERSIKRRYSWINVSKDDICSWIDNCELSWSVLDVLTKIAKNNSNVLSLFENSITWENTTKADFILAPKTFYEDMINSYNKNTLMGCSRCSWWFFDTISQKVTDISKNMKTTWNATKYWKDAWNLLTWNISNAELQKLEKDLLEKELAKQWLSRTQADIILKNLDKFYAKTWWWWYSTENNFITNTITSISNSIWRYIDAFSDVISYLKEADFKDWKKTNELAAEKTKKDATQEMYTKMNTMYASLIKEASMQSIVDEKSIDKLIKIHTTLSQIIQNLEKTVKPAHKVCKSQCTWNWNCDDY